MKWKRKAAAFLLAAVLAAGGNPAQAFGKPDYIDVPQNHWAYRPVMFMAEQQFIVGVGGGRYAPSESVTYAEFLAILGRVALKDEVLRQEDGAEGTEPWYSPYVRTAEELGLLRGTGQGDSILRPISRYEMAKIPGNCLRYLEVPCGKPAEDSIRDLAGVPERYAEDVRLVYAGGLIRGYPDGCFHGDALMSRAEIAVVADNLNDLLHRQASETRRCRLTVRTTEGGTIPAGLETQLNGAYAEGDKITLIVRPMPGFRFVRWESLGGGSFDDSAKPDAVFIMPGNDTVLTAVFELDAENLETE